MQTLFHVCALELTLGAHNWRTVLLVGLVEAVRVAIAYPTLWNAVATAGTSELEVGTGLVFARVSLITAVATV